NRVAWLNEFDVFFQVFFSVYSIMWLFPLITESHYLKGACEFAFFHIKPFSRQVGQLNGMQVVHHEQIFQLGQWRTFCFSMEFDLGENVLKYLLEIYRV